MIKSWQDFKLTVKIIENKTILIGDIALENYDVAIIGGGPAGVTAGIYCGRAELNAVIIEKFTSGGQLATTSEIENYPGFPEGTDAVTLAMDMAAQAKRFGVKTIYKNITGIEDDGKHLITDKGEQIAAKTVILAMGAVPRALGVAGEDKFRGRGVSYCATCDGAFFKNKTVVVVGGGDTAAADAIFLSKICKKVYLVHRRDKLRAAKIYETKLKATENVEFLWNSALQEISGGDKVNSVSVKNLVSGEILDYAADGVFVAVGITPSTDWLKEKIDLDEGGFIVAQEDTLTNVPGVFAAGDCRKKPLRQVVTAAADGAVAAMAAEKYLNEK